MHPCPGTGQQSGVRSFIVLGQPMHLVQDLITGTVGVLTTLALFHMRNIVAITGKSICVCLNFFKPSKFLVRKENIKRLPEIYIYISTRISVTTGLVLVR